MNIKVLGWLKRAFSAPRTRRNSCRRVPLCVEPLEDRLLLDAALVKDILNGPNGSSPKNFVQMGGYAYFTANDGATGNELWRTDGTLAGTTRVADINTNNMGAASSDPSNLFVVNGFVYFIANDGTTGRELFRTDGTTTKQVADIDKGAGDAFASNKDPWFTVIGGTLFFVADDGTGRQIWKTDLNSLATSSVTKGIALSDPTELVALGGSLLFAAASFGSGNELWISDGTAAAPGTSFGDGVPADG